MTQQNIYIEKIRKRKYMLKKKISSRIIKF